MECRYEEENLKVGRKKKNLMFIGDGKGKTIISGGKSVADKMTTFHTASFGKIPSSFPHTDPPTPFHYFGESKKGKCTTWVPQSSPTTHSPCNATHYGWRCISCCTWLVLSINLDSLPLPSLCFIPDLSALVLFTTKFLFLFLLFFIFYFLLTKLHFSFFLKKK